MFCEPPSATTRGSPPSRLTAYTPGLPPCTESKAMLLLSGDHCGEPQPSRFVSFKGYEPSGSLIHISMLPPRLDMNASLRPFGDSRGPSLLPAAEMTTSPASLADTWETLSRQMLESPRTL